ncbi:MAG: hypothetical protein ABI602_03095 [Candidatus Saccharibacteria bacterium]
MSFDSYIKCDSSPEKPIEGRPSFQDLETYAEAGIVKRGIARYLFTRNPERSIKMHTYLGAPLLRKAIMGTYGRFMARNGSNNYRLDATKSKIEAATRFAVGGSVFNEAVHTMAASQQAYFLVNNIAEGRNPSGSVIGIGLNVALVGLQRYNRARMVLRVEEELQTGTQFSSSYKNWLGIDARAEENYRAAQTDMASSAALPRDVTEKLFSRAGACDQLHPSLLEVSS